MNLYRLKLNVHSPWLTPWQSDTLAGLLCWTMARTQGTDILKQEILDPAISGSPPFVVSDAFPVGLFPVPALLRAQPWSHEEQKQVRRARWLPTEDFMAFQQGTLPQPSQLLIADKVYQPVRNLRNQLSRMSNTTSEGGRLFTTEETYLSPDWIKPGKEPNRTPELAIYVRLAEGFSDRFLDLMHELSMTGFGADVSVGKGQFSISSQGLEPVPELDTIPEANASVVLSTFQPNNNDPTDGYWETFTKYGKIGPDFGVENVFKRPLILFRSGACFKGRPFQPRVGRCIPMPELLSPETCLQLEAKNAATVHLAFGLALPFCWKDCKEL